MAKMKDMATLNSAIKSTVVPANYSNVQKLLSSVVAATTALNSLPSEYSRAYAQVQLLKYDENNNPVDVTPDEALSIPNSVIERYKQSWANIKSNIDALNALLSNQAQDLTIVDGLTGFLASDVPLADFSGMSLSVFKYTSIFRLIRAQLELVSAELYQNNKIGVQFSSATFQIFIQSINAALLNSPIICKDSNGMVFTSCVSFQFDKSNVTSMTLRMGDAFIQIGGVTLKADTVKTLSVYELMQQYFAANPSTDPVFAQTYSASFPTDGTGNQAGVWPNDVKSGSDHASIQVSSHQYVNSTVFDSINLQPLEQALQGL